MDGLDLVAIDQIDQEIFNSSSIESDDDDPELPLPDCIGLDSAIQDEEKSRLEQCNDTNKVKTRSELERELELTNLRPRSIRRQILEQSLKDSKNNIDSNSSDPSDPSKSSKTHVMNIVEKAGMSGINKDKINEIIHEASRGSLFYKKQAQRQEEIHKSIERMLNKVKIATPSQISNAKITSDKLMEDLEKQRVFNKVIVHFDLDMFFAAVEIRDNPSLADKPIAVGGDSMVSTSNYIARRYGVRAAMPGFIARKLCPELILIKPNGVKYRQASSEVFDILERYDPDLASMSLDEAYLDLTEYIKNILDRDSIAAEEYYDGTLPKIWWLKASQVVEEIRQAIFDKTKLTCSAGIACNTLIAKISTDINKPDGQFMVEGYPRNVMEFIKKTPVGKVSGIGKVSVQLLNALEMQTCGDMFDKRHFLPLVFQEINVKFYLRVAVGDGSTCIKSDEQRKSKSVERTFPAIKDTLMLLDKLDNICEELCIKYLKPYRIRGRTITIKLKRNNFNTTTRAYSVLVPTNDKQVIYTTAKNLLIAEIANEPPQISYRLLGVKLSNLADESVNANQITIDAMLKNQELRKSTKSATSVYQIQESSNSSSEPATQEEAPDRNVSLKRKADDDGANKTSGKIKKIEDFFTSPSTGKNEDSSGEHQENDEVRFLSQVDSFKGSSQDDEDFRCPYCFKSYLNFGDLQTHTENCYLKSSFDIYSHFSTQKAAKECKSFVKTATQDSQSKKSSVKDSTKRKPPTKRLVQSQIPVVSDSPKVSYYERFMESNSQTLRKSPRVEPLRCPYCMHGFLNFDSLKTHALICIKNDKR